MGTPGQSVSFVMVGSGAVRVNPNRAGPSQIVQVGERALLFDCGRCSVHNMVEFGYPVEEINDVFVTHLHFDHVCELPYFVLLSWNNGRAGRLHVHGPAGLNHFLHHAIQAAYEQDIRSRLGHGKDPAGLDLETVEIQGDGTLVDEEGLTLSSLATPHGEMLNLNYGIDAGGKRVVVTSDTQPSPELVGFCRGADLLVCECSGTSEFLLQQPWGGWHMTPETVAKLATGAEAKSVVLKHFVVENFTDDTEIAEKMAEGVRAGYGGEVAVGHDGLRIEL